MARRRGVLATLVQMQREAERDRARRAQAAARAQRDADRAASARARAAVQDQKLREKLYAEDRAREAAEDTARLEMEVEGLQNVLSATLGVDDFLDLESLKQDPPYPAFDPRVVGAPPTPPREANFAIDGPSTLGRVFGASKHAARAAQLQAEYEQAVHEHGIVAQRHADLVEQARQRHTADIARLKDAHRKHVEAVSGLQRGLVARQPESVIRYLDLVLEAATYPEGFPHFWSLAYASRSGHLTVDYELPHVGVVPTDKTFKYVKSTDTISPTPRPAAQIRSIYTELIRQTALRVVHEILEADRGKTVNTIVFSGYVSGPHPATGREVRSCLISLATSRERFLDIDLGRVDTVACVAHLEARVSKDPGKLQAVEPIELAGSLQADFTMNTDDEPDPDPLLATVVPATPSTAQLELAAGQNLPLTHTRFRVDLQAPETDLSVLLVGSSGLVDQDENFIFYNNPRSSDGAVNLSGQSAHIAVDLLPSECERVVLVASAGTGDSLPDATAVLVQPDGDDQFLFRPTDSVSVSALVWGELYRRNGSWRLRAIGQGWADGLAGLARDYGVNVE